MSKVLECVLWVYSGDDVIKICYFMENDWVF